MALSNHERIGKAIALLGDGLAPFVARECEAEFGPNWPAAVQRVDTRGGKPRQVNPKDPQFLLKVLWDEWNAIFSRKLSRADRSYIAELQVVRNSWAHNESFSTDDALRGLDTAQRLLESVAAGAQANEIGGLHQELLRLKFEEQSRSARRSRAQRTEAGVEAGLPSWREVIEPHDDVTSGRFEMAQYAADLHQVWRGAAAAEYGDPTEFYRRTFITEGLGKLITGAVERFAGAGGDPVVKLQTNFGGGKTHALIALYHLAGAERAADLPGVEDLLTGGGSSLPGTGVRRAVLVGHQLEPSTISRKPDGTEIRTMWGELAWQLGGSDAYSLVAEADRSATSPGAALGEVLRAHAPCLILIDEWVAYARQLYGQQGLPAGTFDAHFSFAQALADAVAATPRALLVATIPASQIEVGGEGGQAALTRLENLFGRVEANWRTASTEESFEIVRRRLFKPLSAAAARRREAVAAAFAELYRANSGEFPSECGEGDYQRRMVAAYPVHPELFDRLFGDWSNLERFQRTRGVLRLMAKVIHSLWMNEDANLLIMPGTIPVDDAEVAAEMTRYLDDGWRPVLEVDVDGPKALSWRLDAENAPLGRYSAARRVARTVYFGSAPSQQAANKGLDDRSIKLGCVQPGERPATFGDALRRLSDRAMYLYRDTSRYWYALAPTVTRLAQDRAAELKPLDVDEAIRRRLGAEASRRGGFAAVHPCPRSPGEVPDEDTVRLVIIDPGFEHDRSSGSSRAQDFASVVLHERSGGARRRRNMVVFLAPDSARLAELRQAARQWLAWDSIRRDGETLNLDAFQARQADTKADEFDETVDQRIAETYQWVLNPEVPENDPTGPMIWDTFRLPNPGTGRAGAGSESLAERVSRKLIADEGLVPGYSGPRLRLDIDRVPLWRGSDVSVAQLWEDFTQYLYLPRLRDRSVLEAAVRDGVASLTWQADGFAYADAAGAETVDGDGSAGDGSAGDETGGSGSSAGRYVGLRAGQALAALAPSGLVVRPDAAAAQLAAERAETGGDPEGPGQDGDGAGGQEGGDEPVPEPGGAALPTRYWGRVTLDSLRWTRAAADIADAIVNQLARVDGATVEITIEVEGAAPEGFDEATQRTVSENAATLKFTAGEFEP
ncbi:MAG: Swt1 family HEPN domain-containing protein [bacterium]|nr:Swt1 family HEPN domain-containing protein [bacterium]